MTSPSLRTRPRLRGALAAVLLALLALTGCGSDKSVDLAGTVVNPPFEVAGDALTTTDGDPYSLSKDTTAPLTLVFFGYTRCPDICPAVLSSIASGLSKLSAAQQEQVKLVFITTDPQRDSPAVLADYVSRFSDKFQGLTGDLDTVTKVAKSIGIFVDDGTNLPGGGYDPNSHGTYVIGLNDRHEAPIFWNGETSPAQFAKDIAFLVDEKPTELKGPNG